MQTEVTIGQLCRVNLATEHLTQTIRRASDDVIKKYKYYKELNNKTVMVLALKKSRTGLNCKVALLDKRNQPVSGMWFTIASRLLKKIDSDSCSCSTSVLMCRGCVCGAFAQEQLISANKQFDSNIGPW